MIRVDELTKRYGRTTAVDALSFEVLPGRVTGFLGPNGAGKSTTMRAIVGLDRPSSGRAVIDGRLYRELAWPLREVGALLEADAFHPGRTAASHLLGLARANALERARVTEVLDIVGISGVANRRVGSFSTGMAQRLGIAAALLGDPGVLIFDEPINGLDPEGIRWFRQLARSLAAEGRTVFVSSHLISEMELTADRLIMIGAGRLVGELSMADLSTRATGRVTVRTPRPERLSEVLRSRGVSVVREADGSLSIVGARAGEIADVAAAAGIPVHELTPEQSSLEDVFFDLTRASVAYRGSDPHGSMAELAQDQGRSAG
jgi:ABC-2 type transport system ATP-binding protein